MEDVEEIQGTGLIADPIYHYIVMTDRIAGEENGKRCDRQSLGSATPPHL